MIKIKIDEIIEKHGLTRYKLAREAKVSPNAILKLVNNETSSISFDMLDRICEVLNVRVEEILEHVPNKKSYGE